MLDFIAEKKNENLYAEPVRFLDDNSFGVAMTEKKFFEFLLWWK